MAKLNKKVVDKFLRELSKLTLKHGIGIAGCGCCGSPFLYDGKKLRDGLYAVDAVDNDGLSFHATLSSGERTNG